MDPSIRLAAERVTAWHLARLRAHIEPPEPTMPDASSPSADATTPADPANLPEAGSPAGEPTARQRT